MAEIEDEPVLDMQRVCKSMQKSLVYVQNQLDNYLTKFIPDGFTEIKEHLFSNDKPLMYRAAHSQVSCTRMVGFFRMGAILDKMQKCVYTRSDDDRPGQFQKYQAFYRLLVKELAKAREVVSKLPPAEEEAKSGASPMKKRPRLVRGATFKKKLEAKNDLVNKAAQA